MLQKDATDKENLIGRRTPSAEKTLFKKSKSWVFGYLVVVIDDRYFYGFFCNYFVLFWFGSETAVLCSTPSSEPRRRKSSQDPAAPQNKIIEEDLTTEGEPSEGYWKALAEKRRIALDISLKENEELHEKIESLEEELVLSREMLEESKNLVELLTEIIQERDGGANDSGLPNNINADLSCPMIRTGSSDGTSTADDGETTADETIDEGAITDDDSSSQDDANPKSPTEWITPSKNFAILPRPVALHRALIYRKCQKRTHFSWI